MDSYEYNEPTEPMNDFEQRASKEPVHEFEPEFSNERESELEVEHSNERTGNFEAARQYPYEETRRDRIFPERPGRQPWLLLPLALLLGTLLGLGLSNIPSVMALVSRPLHTAFCTSASMPASGLLGPRSPHKHRHHPRPAGSPPALGSSSGPRPSDPPPASGIPIGSRPPGPPVSRGSPGPQGSPVVQAQGASPWWCQL